MLLTQAQMGLQSEDELIYHISPSLWNYIISIMHLEDRLAVVRGCLEEGGSILFKSITSNRNPSDSSLLKTCYYHIKSLNETLQHDRSHFNHHHKKENEDYQLPKITNHTPQNQRNLPATSLLPKTAFLLNKLSGKAACGQASSSNLLKLSSSILLRNSDTPSIGNPKEQPHPKKKRPQFKNLYNRPIGLGKEQRFFENQPVKVSQEQVATLGYYEATNIYKLKNTQPLLQQMKVVASRPSFNPIGITNKHDLFLTNLPAHSIDFRVEDFIEQELNKERDCEKVIQKCDSIRASKEILVETPSGEENGEEGSIEQSDLYITIRQCQFVKDESYRLFVARQVDNWGDVLLCFRNIVNCMRCQKISSLKVKADKLTLWGGRKVSIAEMTRLLGLQAIRTTPEKVETVCLGFLGRLRVRRIREGMARQESLARWVCTRFKTFTCLRRLRRQKLQKALRLHRQLFNEMEWDTEIHLPSFSVDLFKRNTTQYLQSFENIYHSIWKNSNKHLVLILPTLNENIIKMLQARIKVKRTLTIICPELHETFPNNLSLAAQVLFSYETLKRLERAIDGKMAVLIPGCYEGQPRPEYEMLLSEYLNVPLLCSLEVTNNSFEQKNFFLRAGIANQPHCIIPPNSSSLQMLESFASLLANFPQDRKWVIKLEGEFKGRGVATIRINPSKYLKKEATAEENKRLLFEHLKANFKLKIKINFQNSLYMVEDFLRQLHNRGGVIEEEVDSAGTYEFCFYKTAVCEFQYLYRVYGTDFSNKVWLSAQPSSTLQAAITAMQDQLQIGRYLGHIIVTVCKGNDGKLYGIDVKLHQTYSSSMISFIRMIEDKRGLVQEEAASIHHLPTKRNPSLSTEENNNYELAFQNYSYLVVPNLVFTDVEEDVKARLIEELMGECWGDRRVKLQEECSLFLSMGVDFAMVLMGRDVRRLKKRAIDTVRELTDRTSAHRRYRGKEVIRDVFQYGDIIRALSQIKE